MLFDFSLLEQVIFNKIWPYLLLLFFSGIMTGFVISLFAFGKIKFKRKEKFNPSKKDRLAIKTQYFTGRYDLEYLALGFATTEEEIKKVLNKKG